MASKVDILPYEIFVDIHIQKILTKLASLSFLADTYYLVLISESIILYGTRRKIREGISKRM